MPETPPPPDGTEPLIAEPKPTGRPSKRTRKRVDRLLALLRGGSTRTAAAGAVGINRVQLQRWMKASAAFRIAVEAAEDQGVVFYEDTIRKAAREAEVIETYDRDGNLLNRRTKYDWRAAAWWLERRQRQAYAQQPAQLELTGGVEVTHSKGTGWQPDAPFAEKVAAILVAAGVMPPDLEPHDLAVALLAPPEPVPAGEDPVDGGAVAAD